MKQKLFEPQESFPKEEWIQYARELAKDNAEMGKAILEAQWNAEGGHWEESACPFCGASPYLGCEEKSIECHSEGCIVRKADLR